LIECGNRRHADDHEIGAAHRGVTRGVVAEEGMRPDLGELMDAGSSRP